MQALCGVRVPPFAQRSGQVYKKPLPPIADG